MYFNKHKIKDEDEESIKRQTYLDNLNRKKDLIKTEFEKLQDEQKFDFISIRSSNDTNFKGILNDIKSIISKKQDKLFKLETQNRLLQNSSSQTYIDYIAEKNSNFITNNSFTKNSYKNKIFESISYKSETNPDILKIQLESMKQAIETTKNNIETEILNKSTIENKLIELENSQKKMISQVNEMNFAKRMTFKRFNNINGLLFNATAKKKTSLIHLNQIRNEVNDINNIENEFFKKKFSIVQQEKHDIEMEQGELSKVLMQIDNAKIKLLHTEKQLRDLEYQESHLNQQRMETFYVKKYINFFKECESLFLNGEIEKKIDYENKMSERDHCQSPKNLSFHFSDEGNLKSPRSTSFKLGILKKKTKNSLIISPNKVNNQSLNIDERLSIVRNIFQFFKDHPLGLEDLIKKILKVYSDLIIRSNSLSGQYEEISALKNKKNKELEQITQNLHILKEKNKDLNYESSEFNEILETENFSLNAGIMQNLTLTDQLITVNQLKHEILPIALISQNEIDQINQKYYENDKFTISTYINVSAKILILSDIIVLISEIAPDFASKELKKLCEHIKIKISNKKVSPKKAEKSGKTSLHLKMNENPLIISTNDTNFDLIASFFSHLFPLSYDLSNLRKFYNSLKNDRVMSYFLNIEIINQFFKSIHSKYEGNSSKILEFFEDLKNKAYEIQKKKIEQSFESFINIFKEIVNYKDLLTETEIASSKLQPSYRKTMNSRLNSFIQQSKKKQIEKIKIINRFSMDSEEDSKDFKILEEINKKVDTLEQISAKESYKPSYYLNVELNNAQKEEQQKSDSEIFDADRNQIKNELMGEDIDEPSNKKQKNKEIPDSIHSKSSKNISTQNNYLKDMLKIALKKDQIEKLDKRLLMTEPILEFQQQLKTEKEKKIYNLYHAEKSYNNNNNQKNQSKINNFKIKNKTLLAQIGKNNKMINQTSSTIIPNSRAQTSSTNNRKMKFIIEPDYYLGPYNFNNCLDYDVLFNKTEDDKLFSNGLNYQ